MSSNGTMHQVLDELLPAPSLPPSRLSPQVLPGASLETLAALQHVLKDNHQRHHIFLNDLSFHNHVTHRALAIYALGGSATIIKDYYELDSHIQRPAIQPPEPITEENFVDQLADGKQVLVCLSKSATPNQYTPGFTRPVTFFSKQVSEKGAARTLEEFVFSEKYNYQEGRDARSQPEMSARFFSGLMHALIYAGYGVEFGLKGMFVEGLALTAVHGLQAKGSLPPSFFTSTSTNNVESMNRLSTLVLDAPAFAKAPVVSKTGGVHVFDIVARILKDDRLNRKGEIDFIDRFVDVLNECSPMVLEHAEKWTVDLNQPDEIERKMEELQWLNALLYGVGGSTPNGFQANFFLMHTVTSSLFLPSLIAYLSPRSQVLLLRGYLHISLTWWVMVGRPALNIKSFMTTAAVEPSIPTTPAPKTPLTIETTPTPNPFLPLLQSAITHPYDHVIKIQRAFAHFDTVYGRRPTGYFKGTGLEDAECLDGSLFLRVALLTADYVGWAREGKEARQFSFEGFYA